MATKRLTAMLAGVSLLAFTTTASASTQSWLETSNWQVWQQMFDNGRQACFAKYHLATETGEATFGFSQDDSKANGTMHYSESGFTWKTVGSLTIQIDGLAPWTVKATSNDDRSLLSVSMGENPGRFLMQIMYGSVLRIGTLNGWRTFSLYGSNQAMRTLFNCVDTIVSQRNGVDARNQPSAPPLPAPRWTPLPRPVIPTAPAQTL